MMNGFAHKSASTLSTGTIICRKKGNLLEPDSRQQQQRLCDKVAKLSIVQRFSCPYNNGATRRQQRFVDPFSRAPHPFFPRADSAAAEKLTPSHIVIVRKVARLKKAPATKRPELAHSLSSS